MDYKKIIKNWFLDKDSVLFYRYKYSKRLFIILAFCFFLNFFLVWANIYDELFLNTITISYYLFLSSLLIFLFYFFKNKLKLNKTLEIVLIIILILLFLVFWFTFSWVTFKIW